MLFLFFVVILAFIIFPTLLSVYYSFSFIAKEIQTNSQFVFWAERHSFAMTLVLLLGSLSPANLTIMSSHVFNFSFFQAPTRGLGLLAESAGVITAIFGDVPHLVVTVMLMVEYYGVWSNASIAFVFTLLKVLFTVARRLLRNVYYTKYVSVQTPSPSPVFQPQASPSLSASVDRKSSLQHLPLLDDQPSPQEPKRGVSLRQLDQAAPKKLASVRQLEHRIPEEEVNDNNNDDDDLYVA